MAKRRAQQVQHQEIHRLRTSNHQEVWANDMLVGHSMWDFRLAFGTLQPLEGKVVVDETTAVHVSPQFLVQIMRTLQVNIAQYESMFGPIQMPKGSENNPERETAV